MTTGKSRLSSYLPYKILLPLTLLLGLVPFFPEPHLVEKLGMLFEGSLRRPIDIFDVFWHGWPIILLLFRVIADLTRPS